MVNEPSETGQSSGSHWFGLDRLRLSESEHAVDITIGSPSHWDRSHLRRLRQSGDLPGMVPIIDSDFSADGKPFAVTPVVDAPTLATLIGTDDLGWADGASAVEAAARAVHEAHLRGLFHGALAPEDVYVIDDEDVAIAGVGLGLGGVAGPDRAGWIAPEVGEGVDPTERSDVYSLGRILEAVLGDSLDSVPRSVRRLIMWSSSDTPEARPPSALEFASILAEGLGEDRRSYGPAFIATAVVTGLASNAGTAVAGHALSETAQATNTTGAGVVAGATAAGASAFLANADTADTEAMDGDVADVDDDDAMVDEMDPGADLDDGISLEPEGEFDDTEAEAALLTAAPDVDITLPANAATRASEIDRGAIGAARRNRAGITVGLLAALGLAAIIWGIAGSGDDSDDTASPSPISDTSLSDDSTSAAADSGSTDEATTGNDTTDEAGTDEATAGNSSGDEATTGDNTTDEAGTDESVGSDSSGAEDSGTSSTEASPAATVEGPIAMSDARVQVLHGIPGEAVDVYVDGEAVATGFTAGTIAGPIDLDPGSYDIQLFAADGNAPAASSDRPDDAIMDGTIDVGSDPTSVIAHLDAAGEPTISTFIEPMATLEPGRGRLIIRHLMAAGSAEARVDGTSIGSVDPGGELTTDLEAGSVMVELVDGDGTVLGSATVSLADGELASLAAIGSPTDGTAEIVAQRYDGLSSAPVAVPTGNSGLLDVDSDQTGFRFVYGVMAMLAVSGAAIALRRRILS